MLAVLAVLATTFVMMARLERRASAQRLYASKALLLARSGVEDALARLEQGQAPAYGGEDWNASGALDGLEIPSEVHGPGVLDTATCPARHAMRPSFFKRSGLTPELQLVEGRSRGFSGRLRGDFQPSGNVYALRASDGGFHVNGGDLATAGETAGTYDTTLKRILGNLAEELGLPRPDGEALVTARPAGGWASFEQIRDLALGGSQAKLASLQPYLILEAWTDARVIRPNVQPSLQDATPRAWAEIRTGASDDGAFTGGRNPVTPAFEARAPVSLAWARAHRPALLALLRDLKALYLDEGYANIFNQGDWIGRMRLAELDAAEASAVADQLVAYTGPLDTWSGFHAFCDGITGLTETSDENGVQTMNQVPAKRDLVKANFNPNADLNKFAPNPALWKSVDKSDLLAHSTEFSLSPVQGGQLACAGRLLDAKGRLLAERTLSATVAPPGLLRLSTQEDFVAGRLPGAFPFLTPSQGSDPTWGHKLLGSQGLALQSYPEPCVSPGPGPGLAMDAAGYDGSLQLATVETLDESLYGAGAGDMLALARFDTHLDLDLATGNDKLQPDAKLLGGAGIDRSLLDPALPNTLHPDGCYSERNRAPAYRSFTNVPPYHGLVSFWARGNHDIRYEENVTASMRYHPYLQMVNYLDLNDTSTMSANHHFLMGHVYSTSWDALLGAYLTTEGWGVHFENGHNTTDDQQEHKFVTLEQAVQPRRWRLVTLFWDLQAVTPNSDEVGDLVLDGGAAAEGEFWSPYDLYTDDPNDVTAVSDLTADGYDGLGVWGPHKFILGYIGLMLGKVPSQFGSGADATLDEFAVYDFGQDETAAKDLASARYTEGRYYKGAAYTSLTAPVVDDQAGAWFSAPLQLPKDAVIRQIHWTWYRPPALPGDYAELALTKVGALGYLWTDALSRSRTAPGWTVDRQRWDVGRAPPGPFRIQAVFRRDSAWAPGTPLIDSPVLDDLTVVYTPPGGPRLSGWSETE